MTGIGARPRAARHLTIAMGYIFHPGLHACDCAGSLVFLDVPADRYFALSSVSNDACLRLISGDAAAPGDTGVIDTLVARGILQQIDGRATPELCRSRPAVRHDLFDTGLRPSPNLVLGALVRHLMAIAELKVRSLEAILGSIALRKVAMATPSGRSIDLAALASAFGRADRLITALGRCLPRSIAVARTMIAHGVAPDLILGVKLRPFEAHCWVEHGDTLVTDDIGTIAPFTPILIL